MVRRIRRQVLVRWYRELQEFVLFGGWLWVLAWLFLVWVVVMVAALASGAGMY